ncbi:hypothetical protein PTTG_02197 [Puccinia triticina 1-1 BBBD Race 1]|uniref:Uncharacterized protein n=2 Tax=Puccinia triticina TaxID=208348 RepID=A0A180GDV0_PUCT1|nr:uncharacterized protein PtA15_5A418 [Puccinia triticina]OAV90860.1 hypothetical protein PTTG_02197 [Puccinia triticina 1-1 BBBD Race 1]WAQ84845.1 hypothetical protein PtA15_5A418 [Puccinia triticina]WAR58193.1 hypothetical protein PtB15_5B425 [Puccinia triticina]
MSAAHVLLRPSALLSRCRPPRRALVPSSCTFVSSASFNSSTPPSPTPAAQPSIPESSVEAAGQATSWIDQLSDFLISQPLQPLSYTATVILATILVRSTTTLPISIWARLRINRFERVVLPTFKAFRTNLALRAKRAFLDPAQIALYQAHLQSQLKRELDRLISENRCRPAVTIVGSLAIHVPVIYGLTTVLRTACERVPPGFPLAIEPSPILGASLLEADLALALVCWAAFLVNIELNASFRYLRRSTAPSASSASTPSQIRNPTSFIARGLSFWTPEKIRSASFLAGVGMMGISSSQPALVLIYWLTSNCFSIVQSLCFIYLDHRHNVLKSGSKDLLVADASEAQRPLPTAATHQEISSRAASSHPRNHHQLPKHSSGRQKPRKPPPS